MPLELTQSRVQKIWIPVDHRPSLPRCECRNVQGVGCRGAAPRGKRIHCAAGAGEALLYRLLASLHGCLRWLGPGAFRSSPERGAGLAGARGGDGAGSSAGAAPLPAAVAARWLSRLHRCAALR